MNCSVCGRGELARARFTPRLLRCTWCGVRSTGRPSTTQFDATYFEQHYHGDDRQSAYRAIVDVARSQLRVGASVLDLGCGAGRLLAELRAAGFDCVGVDSSEAARAATSSVGFEAFASTSELGDRCFAAIFLIDVIAHVVDAYTFVTDARDRLEPNGALVVKTPASTGTLAAIEWAADAVTRSTRSPLLHRASRVNHFDRRSLTRACEAWSLREIEVEPFDEPTVAGKTYGRAEKVAQTVQRTLTRGGSLLAIGRRS